MRLSDIVNSLVSSSESIPKSICDGAQMNSNFEQEIRNYRIGKMLNNEICSTLEQGCQLAHPPAPVPIISNEEY